MPRNRRHWRTFSSLLVRKIYTRLDEGRTEGEEVAFQTGRYEETLGALSRRLADRRRMLRAVGEELEARNDADLSAHDTLLGPNVGW